MSFSEVVRVYRIMRGMEYSHLKRLWHYLLKFSIYIDIWRMGIVGRSTVYWEPGMLTEVAALLKKLSVNFLSKNSCTDVVTGLAACPFVG